MDRAIDFIAENVKINKLALVPFGSAPHTPVVAGPWLAAYGDCSEDEAHYYGCVSAMDHQINRLLDALDEWGIAIPPIWLPVIT